MARALRIAGIVLAALALVAGIQLYRWTHTPYGRMDLGPALIIHLGPAPDGKIDAAARARMNAEIGRALGGALSAGVTTRDLGYEGPGGPQPLRVYTPSAAGPLPVVVWIHGGGFFMGDELPIWDKTVSEVAAGVPALVVSVGYRLAPEHPFPAAVDDCWAALNYVAAHAAEWGGDAGRLAVMGGSAGGNLAAVMAQRARDAGGPKLALQVLVVPATLVEDATESRRQFASGYGLDGVQNMVAAYLPDPAQRSNVAAAPMLAADLAGLPPAVITTAEFDPLRDEGEQYGEKLRAAGVPVTARRYPGTVHGFFGSPDDGAAAQALAIEKLREAFAPAP